MQQKQRPKRSPNLCLEAHVVGPSGRHNDAPALSGRTLYFLALGMGVWSSLGSEAWRGSSSAFAKLALARAVLAFGESVTTGRSANADVVRRTAFDDSRDARRRRRSTSLGQIFDHPPTVFYIHGGRRC
jgi:hypothetical protein